jgi:DNA integrity scanning protein DisA with diadenylate cyclase activity
MIKLWFFKGTEINIVVPSLGIVFILYTPFIKDTRSFIPTRPSVFLFTTSSNLNPIPLSEILNAKVSLFIFTTALTFVAFACLVTF